MAVQQRWYRRRLIGSPRLVGWCDACGFLAEVETGRHDALVARLARHHLSAHRRGAPEAVPQQRDRWTGEPTVEEHQPRRTTRAAPRAQCHGHHRR
jgi:hypothetical protein